MPKMSRRRIKVAGGQLPYAEHAHIDQRKLTEFALNPEKSDKARGFAVMLGLGPEDWRNLHDQIIERVPDSPLVSLRLETKTGWPEFEVEIPIDGHEGRTAPICTGWMVDERHEPWLVTTHVIHGSASPRSRGSDGGHSEVSTGIRAEDRRADRGV
jgi:uncharacterized protein DUF6883